MSDNRLQAKDAKVNDVVYVRNIANTTFQILRIQEHRKGWEEFDLTFTVKELSYPGQPIYDIHCMKDEFMGFLDSSYKKLA